MLSSLILSLMAVSSLHSEASMRDYITARAMENGVRPDLAVAIVQAESSFNPNAKNASSSASGIGQFINSTFQYLCIDRYKLTTSMDDKNNPYVGIECLVRRLSEPGGVKEWDASKSLWSRHIAPLIDV